MPPDEPVDPAAIAPTSGASEAEPAAPAAPADASAAPATEPSANQEGVGGSVTPHTDTPTLLEEGAEPAAPEVVPAAEPEAPKPEETPEVVPPAEAPKPEEPKPAEPEVPIVYELAIPEGLKADPETMAAYTGVLQEHRVSPEAAQRFLDMHNTALQAYAAQTLDAQHRAFADTRKGWRTEIMGDEQLGGAGFKTVATQVAQMRDMFVPEADRAAFNDFLRVTGAGDHPAFWRLLNNAAKFFGEPKMPPEDAKPAPNQGGSRSRIGDLYTHPTSRPREG